ncbi:hypothetical protein NQ176_g412 [Zarea fungicola]|uniref:Uncharacterized protein n=1 Tax=Zarea fungicola TaxID=93591 RepID=A0ACC1NZG4_9HYPO|nr:hypothetical protein NQ176_g412 [Lecanicillium fungicola]
MEAPAAFSNITQARNKLVLSIDTICRLLEQWKLRAGEDATEEETEQAEQLLDHVEKVCLDAIAVIQDFESNLWVREIKFVEVLAFVYRQRGLESDSNNVISRIRTLADELNRNRDSGTPLSVDGFEDRWAPTSTNEYFMCHCFPDLVQWVYLYV